MSIEASIMHQPAAAPAEVAQPSSIKETVVSTLNDHFADLGDQEPNGLYNKLLAQVERPLLEAVMEYTKGNQSRAAIILGISRGTLRKKLKIYGLD